MARLMIQGTTSSAGKSLICSGLCRIFKEDGYRVLPYKSQNMSSGYHTDKEGTKLSFSQVIQALAAGVEPSPAYNTILLIPKSQSGSLVVLRGQELSHMEARDYFKYRKTLKEKIYEDYKKLEESSDIVVIEGAGSPAEINLKENDIVNMGMAELADAPVFLVADIDRGGVFASLYGTVMLLSPEERARVKGLIINKFRGDIELLKPGIEMFKEYLDIPVIGTIPFMEENIEATDLDDREALEGAFDRLADHLRNHLDLAFIYRTMGL